MIEVVAEALEEFGKTVTFVTVARRDYDAAAGSVREVRPEPLQGKITPPAPWQRAPLPGTTATEGTMEAYTFPGFEPTAGMVVKSDGVDWRVLGVGKIYSGDLVALYLLMMET
jgi:hypothetical protein